MSDMWSLSLQDLEKFEERVWLRLQLGSQSLMKEMWELPDGGNEGKGMLEFLSSWKPLEIPDKCCKVRPYHFKKVLKIPG